MLGLGSSGPCTWDHLRVLSAFAHGPGTAMDLCWAPIPLYSLKAPNPLQCQGHTCEDISCVTYVMPPLLKQRFGSAKLVECDKFANPFIIIPQLARTTPPWWFVFGPVRVHECFNTKNIVITGVRPICENLSNREPQMAQTTPPCGFASKIVFSREICWGLNC